MIIYSIYADNKCIYNDSYMQDDRMILNPKLTLQESSAGSLTMTLPPTNRAYDTIDRMVTDISVRKHGEEIWSGRVLSEETDFWNNRVLLCEGELAFLNDTIQPPAEYHDLTVRGFLETLIRIHNSKVAKNRQFTVGTVTVTDPNDSLYRYTNYETTIECIYEKLLGRLGGHLRVRKENGTRYIDYLKDYPNQNSQKIEFGKNLLDFTGSWDSTEFATVIIPLGCRLEESDIEKLDAYLTVKSVNNGSIYVKSQNAIDSYGWIEKVVRWDDVTTPQALLSKAKKYLSELQFDNMKIEVSALDLHYMDISYEDVKMLDKLQIVSPPHGLNRNFPVTKIEIPLDQPERTAFTLGGNVRNSFVSKSQQSNVNLGNAIKELPKASSILQEARENATSLINMATNGYITFVNGKDGTPEELLIMDKNDVKTASHVWRWNINGLGYSSNGYKGPYTTAITMDGKINADFILAGKIFGQAIEGGTIKGASIEGGVLKQKRTSGDFNTYFKIEDGEITGGYTNYANGFIDMSSSVNPDSKWSTNHEDTYGRHPIINMGVHEPGGGILFNADQLWTKNPISDKPGNGYKYEKGYTGFKNGLLYCNGLLIR